MDSLATGAMPITSGPTALKTLCGKFDYNGSFNKAMKIHGEHQPASPPLTEMTRDMPKKSNLCANKATQKK
jgi:hypothetical protein